MKIIINKGSVPFKFSQLALSKLKQLGFKINNKEGNYKIPYFSLDEYRTDKKVINALEQLGVTAGYEYVRFKIVEIPDDIEWYIDVRNNEESIHEKHKVWN